jgi:hypothetical protein
VSRVYSTRFAQVQITPSVGIGIPLSPDPDTIAIVRQLDMVLFGTVPLLGCDLTLGYGLYSSPFVFKSFDAGDFGSAQAFNMEGRWVFPYGVELSCDCTGGDGWSIGVCGYLLGN